MKIFCAIAIVILMPALLLRGQTNNLPIGPATITSHTGFFSLNSHTATYQGNVQVDDPQMTLRCEWLMASMPPSGGRIDHIVCETNVVIDYFDQRGQTNHITSDKAIYDYNVQGMVTNESITFTGNPRIENAQTITIGEPIIWNRADGNIVVMNGKTTFKQGIGGLSGLTNSVPK
ncbi:MAG TPA: LptA/OstA family protein [Verrucomicrobiae bacterium]